MPAAAGKSAKPKNRDEAFPHFGVFPSIGLAGGAAFHFPRQRITLGFAAAFTWGQGFHPAWRSRRQLTRCEEYKPSRRRSAPTPPEVACSIFVSFTMRSLYAAVKTRRFALTTTSESGGKTGTAPVLTLADAALRSGSQTGPSLRCAADKHSGERIPDHPCLLLSRPSAH